MIEIVENKLDVETYLDIRASVHWKVLRKEQAEKALNNSLYTVMAVENGKTIGMGRIVICYIQDFVVRPEYQGTSIGRKMMERLIAHVEELRMDQSEMMLCLMCAKGRERFYEKFGFIGRPTENLGPGMIQYLK